jgi:glutathione S-transferase
MSLIFYYHPLSSFCQKALIALYETGVAFTPQMVNLGDPADSAAFKKVWPPGKFPVLRDEGRGQTVPESSIIVEYLALHYPGTTRFIPADPERAWQARLNDRFFDLHVHVHMQKIVTDKLRPAGLNDSFGVEQARAALNLAYDMIEDDMSGKEWAVGDDFTIADCAAAPALFFANIVQPFGPTHANAAAYLDRLMKRPSYARARREAEPYMKYMPR